MERAVSAEPAALADFQARLTAEEARTFQSLNSPQAIQAYLNRIPYSTDAFYRCPLRVLREEVAHCFDGALFAAAALRRLGYPPLIMELIPNERDDDHLLALFRQGGHWGAVGKSNFVGLRYREPIHRTLRELVMTYFEPYFNVLREKTLRGYRRPLNLSVFDRRQWMASDGPLEDVAARLDEHAVVGIVTPEMIAGLAPVDERSYRAGLMGADREGLFPLGS